MKILTIHADFIEFQPTKKALKDAQKVPGEKKRVDECLVIFTAVEKKDEENLPAVTQKYVQEIKNVALQVNAKNIVLYPYAHLSSALSSPKAAEQVLNDAEQLLREKYKVTQAPFGWYKAFTLSCKGHPLSELSREFSADGAREKETRTSSPKREFKDVSFTYHQKEPSKEEKLNLSTAFIAAEAVKTLYPEARIGEVGLHYGQAYVDFSEVQLHNEDFSQLEQEMQKIVNSKVPLGVAAHEEVKDYWQREILKDIGQDKMAYKIEKAVMVPFISSPFVASTGDVPAFKLLKLGSAYWKGNEQNQQLARIYCVGFRSRQKLEEFMKLQEEAEQRSHIRIGKEQGLFVVSELVGAGLPLLAPKGAIIRQEIIKFLWELHKDKGYQQVVIPHIAKDSLYQQSGHWEKFGSELFQVKGKYEQLVLKPMNCPHHIQIFDNFSWSYRDLPVRYFEPTTVYRDEKTGQLVGLSRVRSITQDDGHIFCRVSQIAGEVSTIAGIIAAFYRTFGMDKEYWVSLSVRGEDQSTYLGSKDAWDAAEKALEAAARQDKLPYTKTRGEATFYGPKLDFMFKDALGREWQLATIQLDFNLPERFDLSYINEESKKERPVMIHRAISGSLERFMSIVIEHFAGKFPLWLSPVQVKVLTITDRSKKFAQEVYGALRQQDIRVELDDRTGTMGKKVREAAMQQVNYIVTIGDTEVEKKCLAVRDRSGKTQFEVNVEDFVGKVVKEIKGRVL